ncbi:MAG: hypothetical protein ACXWBP_02490 [Limisphaerales bacterium]
MDFDYIKAWLDRYNAKVISKSRFCTILGLILFPIGLIVGFLLVLLIVGVFTTDRYGRPRMGVAFWVALACVPLMFLGNYLMRGRRERKHWEDTSPDGPLDMLFLRYKIVFAVICWILFTGPRLLTWSIESFGKARTIGQQDTHSCAALLWMLASRPNRVPFEEIPATLEWLNLETTLPEVQKIPGVIYLAGPPAGLTLSTDLRTAIKNDKFPD